MSNTSTVPFLRHPATPLRTCSGCGASGDTVPVYGLGDHTPLCLPCWTAQQAAGAVELPYLSRDIIETDLDQLITSKMQEIGWSEEELRASLELISPEVMNAIMAVVSRSTLDQLLSGGVPKGLFGLVGFSGTGKTSTLAALVRVSLTNSWRMTAPMLRCEWTGWAHVRMVSWPALALRWKLYAMTSAEEMQDRLRLYSQVKLLILDDIGRERSKDLESDRVTAVLDGVVSARDRAGLPTLWTSNLRDDDLAVAYGESFHRRLVRANPAVILPDTAPLFT